VVEQARGGEIMHWGRNRGRPFGGRAAGWPFGGWLAVRVGLIGWRRLEDDRACQGES